MKIENPRATANVDSTVRVPGVAYAEWGPGDQSLYLLGPYQGLSKDEFLSAPPLAKVRVRVQAAKKRAGISPSYAPG